MAEAKTLYVNAERADIQVDGEGLRVLQPEQAVYRIPLHRVGRAVIRGGDSGLLAACLAIVARGGCVHFEGSDGTMNAVLQHPQPSSTRATRELAGAIQAHGGLGPFHWWCDAQQRHAWSLVFRRGPTGDFEQAHQRLQRYLANRAIGLPIDWEMAQLNGQLHAWLQAELDRQGFRPVLQAVASQGGDLTRILQECLALPLHWAYVRWRHQQPSQLEDRALIGFFELQSVAPLPNQLHRHLAALAHEYHTYAFREA